VKIEYTTKVERLEENYNKIDFFFMYSDPSGRKLYGAREERS